MTVITPYPDLQGTLSCFQSVDVDSRLRVLWRAYQSWGQTFAASPPVALFSQSVQFLIKQLNLVPQEEQLAILQDILGGADTRFTRAYNALNGNMKLAFWHRLFHSRQLEGLAYGQLSPPSQVLLTRLSRMGLNERLNFLRQALS